MKRSKKNIKFDSLDYHAEEVYKIFLKHKADKYQTNYIRIYEGWLSGIIKSNPLLEMAIDHEAVYRKFPE